MSATTARAHFAGAERSRARQGYVHQPALAVACAQRDFPLGMEYIVAFSNWHRCGSLGRAAVRSVAMRKVVLRESRLESPSLPNTVWFRRWTWGASLKFEAERGGCVGFNHKATKMMNCRRFGGGAAFVSFVASW